MSRAPGFELVAFFEKYMALPSTLDPVAVTWNAFEECW
jgi:hypothetical protein